MEEDLSSERWRHNCAVIRDRHWPDRIRDADKADREKHIQSIIEKLEAQVAYQSQRKVPSEEEMLCMRMRVTKLSQLKFPHIQVIPAGVFVHVTVLPANEADMVVLRDEKDIFPSDALITKLRMIGQ